MAFSWNDAFLTAATGPIGLLPSTNTPDKRFGDTILGTVEDLIAAYGENATNRSDADAARIAAAQSQILINEQQALASIRAKEKAMSIATAAAVVLLIIAVVLAASSVYKNAK